MNETGQPTGARVGGFCPDCGVTLGFHDGPDSCEDAARQAQRLEDMERMMFGGLTRP